MQYLRALRGWAAHGAGPLVVCVLCTVLFAGQTRTWSENDYAGFQKGSIKNLSLSSDGVLTLAPRFKEFYDSSAMYLWSLARDSKGNLYTGGGSGAKLYRIGADGKGKVLAELDALEIHAIAVDSKDRVYVATEPDGKIYRVSGNGKPEVYYDPKTKYIWALALDRQDNLFVATGDPGEIHRVTPDGKGKVFFQCEETHVRSLAIDPKGNVIVGTAPGGLVLRVSPAGEGFVLYQTSKQEVTAVAVGSDGSIYASAVGSRQAGGSIPQPAGAPAATPTQLTVTVGGGQATARPAGPAPAQAAPVRIVGGSDVYRIDPAAGPRRIWNSAQDVVYAIAFDSAGRVLLGAGNRGNIFRIDSPTAYTNVLTLPVTQVTAFQSGAGGRLYAITGNVGKVYEIDSAVEQQGTIESEVFDAGMYTQWGRVSFEGKLNGGGIAVETRSGNLDQPQKNWSPWSDAIKSAKGGRVTSPAARFVQWRATLTAAASVSPELESVDVAYLPKNVEPRVEQIEITPANYKFPAPSGSSNSQTLSLPPMTGKSQHTESRTAATEAPITTTPAMLPAKGFLGARWMASDPNDDTLIYTVEIRGVNETEWKPLKEKVAEKYVSWDSTAFPDGEYRLRITASDAPSNPPGEALTARLESDPFLIDNTPPKITGLAASRNAGKLQIRWHAADALNDIAKAEYSLDGGDWTVVSPTSGLSDSQELDYELNVDAAAGEHTVAVRVEDDYENQGTEKVVVR
jgi:sugar lactone lactonase YvrE